MERDGYGCWRQSGSWKQLVPTILPEGYEQTCLGAKFKGSVHRLILEAFHGPCPDGMESCHNNGIRSDNRVINLRWDTRKNNHADKHRHGTRQVGERHGKAKLTDDNALEIRQLASADCKVKQLKERFNVCSRTIQSVISRETYAHI